MKHRRSLRVVLLVLGLGIGLLLAESALRLLGLPRVYQPRSTPGQFKIVDGLHRDGVGYVNAPSQVIRFTYDGNPRDYFGEQNEVNHHTNSLGFRGTEQKYNSLEDQVTVIEKKSGSRRIIFLGDSFTFGEGVWFADTYCEQSVDGIRGALSPKDPSLVQGLNLGVGGYNTAQSRDLLEKVGLPSKPDLVVLGYVLNDAEPPLFQKDPQTGQPYRVYREIEEMNSQTGADRSVLRTVDLARSFFRGREQTRETVAFYRKLYEDDSSTWRQTRDGLRSIGQLCAEAKIPCVIMVFPIFVQLDDNYPLRDVHQRICKLAEDNGMYCLDLLPHFVGMSPSSLWVHPTDQHPNEKAHKIAATALIELLLDRPALRAAIQP